MDEDYAWIPVVAGIVAAIWILSMIPLWVYVTLGCLLAAAFLIWLLGVCGVYRAIGSWWGRKSVDGRIRFRKDCWWVVIGTVVVLLCGFFPIEAGIPVALLVSLSFGAQWFVRRRMNQRLDTEFSDPEQATT